MSDGTVACWGNNSFGQATPPSGTFTQISAGGYYNCGVRADGTVGCWGQSPTPPGGTFTQVAAGGSHTCGLKGDGTVACWGNNGNGQATPPAAMPFSLF
jgi:alpha-tubulin suppressor-like RCC1 family protein